ncbi:MAG: DUF6527 family protein [Devosia sp.]|nr:DUF6527 family protein [Devosia sp.]
MIKYARLEHRFVDDMPEQLEPGYLYVSMRYATVMHLCCCGCGREVVTPLSPAQWRMTFDGESVSLSPSIGSWALDCRSHYFITKGEVIEAATWSADDVERGRAHDKRKRSEHFESKVPVLAAPPPEKKAGWFGRMKALFRREP